MKIDKSLDDIYLELMTGQKTDRKRVYFVRHGESEGNSKNIHQGPTGGLSDEGRQQAKYVAERCAKLPIDIIVSSTMKRASETAEIINEKLKKPIEYSALFVEKSHPTNLWGKSWGDPEVIKILGTIKEKFHQNFRYSDEENFEDIKLRLNKAMQHLVDRPEQNILVVTHGLLLRFIMSYVIFGGDLNAQEAEKVSQNFQMENTGITVLNYYKNNNKIPWRLWIWNDHAHLG